MIFFASLRLFDGLKQKQICGFYAYGCWTMTKIYFCLTIAEIQCELRIFIIFFFWVWMNIAIHFFPIIPCVFFLHHKKIKTFIKVHRQFDDDHSLKPKVRNCLSSWCIIAASHFFSWCARDQPKFKKTLNAFVNSFHLFEKKGRKKS